MFAKKETINWGERAFASPAPFRLQCGHLLVEFSHGEDEVFLASRQLSDEEAGIPHDRDEPVAWTSWAVCTGTKGVRVLPSLPELPVLASQDPAFEVEPGQEARVYLRLPVTVQVRLSDREDDLLAEFPSETMPRVEFGEESAETCYRLSSGPSPLPFTDLEGSEVQAPVLIRNESRETLRVTQLCLRVARLAIYRAGSSLWTGETTVRYQGGPHPSRISVRPGPPPEAPQARLLTAPREAGSDTIVARTFRSFRRWAGEWR